MSAADFDALFKELREQADKDLWSKAAIAVRAPIVAAAGDNSSDRYAVTDPQTKFSYTVELFPADLDWTCDCSAKLNPCIHVLCAAIAKRQQASRALATKGQLRYSFFAIDSRLALRRELVRPTGEVEAFKLSLTNEKTRHIASTLCTPTEVDVRFELELRQLPDGSLNPEANASMLVPMSDLAVTYFDGKEIAVSSSPFGWTLNLEKEGPLFRVRLTQTDASLRFSNGWALVNNQLRPIAKLPQTISPSEIAALQQSKLMSERDYREFCALRLSLYRDVCEVNDRTSLHLVTYLPRAELVCERVQHQLMCTGRIVYGDPAVAAIEAGKLRCFTAEIPHRSIERELSAIRQFETYFGFAIDQTQNVSDERAVQLAIKISQWNGDIEGDAWKDFEIRGTLEPYWQGDELLFRVSASTSQSNQANDGEDIQEIEFNKVANHWLAGNSLLPSNGLLKIPSEWFAEHQSWVLDYLAASTDQKILKSKQLLRAQLQAEFHGRFSSTVDALKLILDAKNNASAEPKVVVDAQLRPYQRAGVAWLSALQDAELGGILADDMGLGKTLQTIAAARGPVLIVAPTSLLRNWQKEWLRFRPDIDCYIYHGGDRQWQGSNVCITSYGILRNDIEMFVKVNWHTLILDEAHQVKNSESLIFNALKRLHAKSCFALTGTPIENDLLDIWGVMQLVNPGLLPGEKQVFREIFASDSGRKRLKLRLEPFLLRRTKTEVLSDLPPKFENIVPVTMGEPELKAYKAIAMQAQAEIRDGGFMQTLAWITRLRQFACDPGLVNDLNQTLVSAKIELLIEMLQAVMLGGHRALVFSQWTSLLDRIEVQLNNSQISFSRIDGSTSAGVRANVVDEFQQADDLGPRVLLMSLKAGGVGLNLTAADHVFIMDPWWNPAAEAQAADRAHRIGQNRAVNIYKLITEQTIEEKIIVLQQRKKDLARDILEKDSDSGFNQLSITELRELLE